MKTIFSIFVSVITITALYGQNMNDTPDFSHHPPHVCEYLTENYNLAVLVEYKTGTPAWFTLSVSALESNYGRSRRARKKNNYFGLELKRVFFSKAANFYYFGHMVRNGRYKRAVKVDPNNAWLYTETVRLAGYNPRPVWTKRVLKVFKYINGKKQLLNPNRTIRF
jgi:hypothetical protein